MSIRNILIFVCLVSLVGCVSSLPRESSMHEQQEALRLIDQGTFFLREGALSEARASFEVAYDIEVSSQAMDGLGCVAFLEGDFKLARDYFLAAYRYDSSYVQSLTNLALLYDHIGAKREAQLLYERALQQKPNLLPGRNNLGVLHQEGGDTSQAKQELFRAYVVLPHEILGNNLEKVGERPWQQ